MEACRPAPALSTLTCPSAGPWVFRAPSHLSHRVLSVWESLAPDHLWLPPSHFPGLSSNAFGSVDSSATTLPKEALPSYSPSNDFYEPTGRNAFCLRSQYSLSLSLSHTHTHTHTLSHTHTHTHTKAKDSQNPTPYCT